MSYIKVPDLFALENYFTQLLDLMAQIGKDANKVTRNYYTAAVSQSEEFLTAGTISKHMNDFASEQLRGAFISYDKNTGEESFDFKGYKAELRKRSKQWLTKQKEEWDTLTEAIGNKPFASSVSKVSAVGQAMIYAQSALKSLDSLQLSLKDEIEKIVGIENMDGYTFEYVSTIGGDEFHDGSDLLLLKFLTEGGEAYDAKDLTNAASDGFWQAGAAVILAGTAAQAFLDKDPKFNPGAYVNRVLAPSLDAVGANTSKNASNGYYSMDPQEVYETVHPGEVFNPEETKEKQSDYFQRVYGFDPYANDGDDKDNPVAAPYVGAAASAFLTVMTAPSPADNTTLDSDRDTLLEGLGSNKTVEEARQTIDDIREEREKAEQKLSDIVDEDDYIPRQVSRNIGNENVGTNVSNNVNHTNQSTADVVSSLSDTHSNIGDSPAIVDVGGRLNQSVDTSIGSLLKPKVDIDAQALNDYYNKDLSAIESDRAGLLGTFEDAYNGINVDQFKDTLSKGGYSTEDINYILEHKEVGFTALVMATQTSALTDISTSLANSQGMTTFASTYSEGLRLEDLLNGRAQASLGVEMDPDVSSARSTMSSMRNNYNDSVNKANESIKQAEDDKASLDKIRQRIIKKSGTDSSNWSDEEVKEYNDAVNKYNDSNAKANADVAEANRLKGDLEKFEGEFEELKNKKFDELLKDYQDSLSVSGDTTHTDAVIDQHVDIEGQGTPSPTYDGSDDAILDSIVTGEGTISTGDPGQVGGVQTIGETQPVTEVVPQPIGQQQVNPGYDGSDQAILGGLNLGGSDLSIGAPDPGVRVEGATMNMEAPVPVQPVSGSNIRVNSSAFSSNDADILNVLNMGSQGIGYSDDRVIPGLGLNVDMTTITGGNVNGINISAPQNAPQAGSYSDAAILNGLTVTENSISNGSAQAIETPSLNTLPSSGFDQAMSGFASTESEREERRETSKKTDSSRFVEAPTSQNEQNKKEVVKNIQETKVQNGIAIEIGEDGSLRL